MRYASLLPPLVLALTVAACAQQQPAYYMTNSVTGQRVATGQQPVPDSHRGLLGAGGSQASGYNSYASATPQQQDSGDRGLFNSHVLDSHVFQSSWFSRQSSTPTYAAQPQVSQAQIPQTQVPQTQVPRTYVPHTYAQHAYAPRTYSYQPPPQQAYVQRQATMQYRPPQPVQQHYTPQQYYRPPQPQRTGYYTARYGLY